MGCAIIYDNVGIRYGVESEKFNGVMLRMALEFAGYNIEEFAERTGKRYNHWLEIIEGLKQPTDYDISCILEHITSFLIGFYYFETYIKDTPDKIFVCGKGIRPCANCGQVSDYLCDYPIGEGKICDLPICQQCRTHIGKYDFCPIHNEANKVIRRL